MKPTEKFIYHAAVYTVSISLLFFIFARFLDIDELTISLSRYFTIFALSLVISGAEFILTLDKLPRYLRHIIHYAVLAISFLVIFLTVRTSSGEFQFRAATVFAALIIFSFLYFVFTVLFHTIIKPHSKKEESDAKKSKKPYTNRFSE